MLTAQVPARHLFCTSAHVALTSHQSARTTFLCEIRVEDVGVVVLAMDGVASWRRSCSFCDCQFCLSLRFAQSRRRLRYPCERDRPVQGDVVLTRRTPKIHNFVRLVLSAARTTGPPEHMRSICLVPLHHARRSHTCVFGSNTEIDKTKTVCVLVV